MINPRKRIAAEMRWFDIVDFKDLFSLAGLNKLLYSFDALNDADNLETIIEINALYCESTAEKIRKQINAVRAKSKFPAVQDIDTIKSELKNIRYDVREKIQARLKNLTHEDRTKLANDLAEILINNEENFGIIVEDFFECYRLEMRPFLDENGKQIISLLSKIKIRADKNFLDELVAAVESFAAVIKPLDKFSFPTYRRSLK